MSNLLRDHIRQETKINEVVEESLQGCLVSQNRLLLENEISKYKVGSSHSNTLRALLYIWDRLSAEIDNKVHSYISFNEAYDIFIAFRCSNAIKDTVKTDYNFKNQFRLNLLNPNHGLRVYIVKQKGGDWIVLKPDNFDLSTFFLECFKEKEEECVLNKELMSNLFLIMDSEWDKKILRYVLSLLFTRFEIDSLGVDSDSVLKDQQSVNEFINEMATVDKEAENDVIETLQRRRSNLLVEMTMKRKLLMEKRCKWNTAHIQEKQEEMEDLLGKANELKEVYGNKDEVENQKSWKARVSRKRKDIIDERRWKKRKLGSGRKQMIDVQDEEYIAKCIEDKATAHGRRHDSTLYLNHRVKKRDLLKLLNHHHHQRNLPLLKSCTSIYNRGRSKRKNSIQAKHHLGSALWCCKKSPKSESRDNLLTHYCRAAKKNVIRSLSSVKDLVLYRSFDDKAYICPETSTGMQSTRAQKVLTVTDENKAKRFMKYDFPPKKVSCTPGVFLYATKEVQYVDGIEKVVTATRDVVCRIKPKFYVGSSGSVWGSHLMNNRSSEAILHRVSHQSNVLVDFQSCFLKIMDAANSFRIQSVKDDIVMVCNGEQYLEYEKEKLTFLKDRVDNFLSESVDLVDVDEEILAAVTEIIEKLSNECHDVELLLENGNVTSDSYWEALEYILQSCIDLKHLAPSLNLPELRPYVVDLTDAGPGVGVTNHEVYYRTASEVMICNYDYYIRLHMAPLDSSSNDVERIQSSVGDAICDGTYLNFEHFKRFEDLSEEEIEGMSPEEHEEYDDERMHRNAIEVCKEVSSRIDKARTVDGYMKSYVSEDIKNMFFWDTKFLKKFLSVCDTKDFVCPGAHYYESLRTFMSTHVIKGEKFLEFVKFSCSTTNHCQYCVSNPWAHSPMKRISQPYPNPETKHYFHISETPAKLDGKERGIDDFNPRVQLKNAYDDGSLKVENIAAVDEFSHKYIVEKNMVTEALNGMMASEIVRESKSKARKKKNEVEKGKTYDDYNWKELIEDGGLKKLVVGTLDKYIRHHSLDYLKSANKPQKVEGVRLHYMRHLVSQSDEDINIENSNDDDGDESDTDCDSSDDEVLTTNRLQQEMDSDDDNFEDVSLFRTNRYGRFVGSTSS